MCVTFRKHNTKRMQRTGHPWSIRGRFQSAYKTGHSCETALLRVYNDIVTTIGRGRAGLRELEALGEALDEVNLVAPNEIEK